MSLWSRLSNLFRGDRVSREIDEELQSHIKEAIEQGRDPEEARRAFGSVLRRREESRDLHLIPWLDSLRADAVFGWRQMMKRKVTSAAAILSLGLAIGACTSAFRLIDALLLRPLPVSHPERLYSVAFENIGADGRLSTYDSCSYPMFREMRDALKEQAELTAVSYADRVDLTYGREEEMERAYLQFVSGGMFDSFGLRPALGRPLTAYDDVTPGAHPVAVLSHDYWTRRFGQDPGVIGRTFHLGEGIYEIVGVLAEPFTGTETGTMTDIFTPMMMKNPRTLASSTNFWLRTFVELNPGVDPQPVYDKLRATYHAIQEERAKGLIGMKPWLLQQFLQEKMLLEPAAAGRSNLQRDYRRSLMALGILVMLVLLIACANVANLMTAQAAARGREMALRVSIGAGRGRLVQLVLVECAWLAFMATAVGALFAWRSAPLIVSMIHSPDSPARIALPADWRVLAFSLLLACAVTFLFGLGPALRASSVQPSNALKGGAAPRSGRRLMHGLIALQVAFCFVVLFVAGLFRATFDRLSAQPTGFSAERILNLEARVQQPQSPVFWDQVAEHLRAVPGVETVALTVWPLMSGESSVGTISINGAPPSEVISDFLRISPGWFDTMRIPMLDGHDFNVSDTNPPAAIVNQAFAKQFFNGQDPVGKSFESEHVRFQIVGFVPDARSRDDLRLPIRPIAYFPFHTVSAAHADVPIARGTFVVRTQSRNPLALSSTLRREIPRARREFYVSNIRTQVEIDQAHAVRERLLATLGMFFAAVALLLAGIGLYGLLDYGVLQRRREIGIRMAIGAQAADIVQRVTAGTFVMILAGAILGGAFGIASVRYIEMLLYEVRGTDLRILVAPSIAILAVAFLAALPAVIRAMRIDPVNLLRTE